MVNFTDQLIKIHRGTGVGTAVGPIGHSRVEALALDRSTGKLFGVDNQTRVLIRINTTTGKGAELGSQGFGTIGGLAFNPDKGRLYGIHAAGLMFLNASTGAWISVGQLGFQLFSGLAYDEDACRMYATNGDTGELIEINSSTGKGTSKGILAEPPGGLAFDTNANTLWGSNPTIGELIDINPITRVATRAGSYGLGGMTAWRSIRTRTSSVRSLGRDSVHGLALDTVTLYGVDTLADQLLKINRSTGAATAYGYLGISHISSLAFNRNTGTL